MVNTLFNPQITTEIYKILLSLNKHNNKWVWTDENDGHFSMRSAYRLLQNLKRQSLEESSNSQAIYSL